MLDAAIDALLKQMSAEPAPKLWEMPVADGRQMYVALSGALDPKGVPIGKTENREAAGPAGPIPLRIYTPVGAGNSVPGLVYFHGGGFVIGNLETHDVLCRLLANESGCRVVAVDYRLAPEHKFPAAAEDCFAALQWVELNAGELGIDPNRLAVGGDSAGGNLAAVVAQLAKSKGGLVDFQLLIYPTTQAYAETESMNRCATGYFLEKAAMTWFYDQYVSPGTDANDPRLSPLAAADLSGLPPAYVVTAGFDPLRDEGRQYAEKLRAAGVPVTHVDYESMIHGFFNMSGVVSLAADAIRQAAHAVRDGLA